ncbi:MAG: prepilin-type N-terminal cleavage/methylation domain-containing protein [Rheinheimera sp.]|nr:prepilin-type N-terminal cleavage/methylation domain-containing protein [Rheinheimera sp.]
MPRRIVRVTSAGFTLVELVIGIVVLAIALTLLTGVLAPLHRDSGAIWLQVRSSELAQSLLSEVMARSFDENSSRNGSPLRCGEAGASSCAAAIPACPASGMSALTEEASRQDYDDVDDFHCLRADAASLTDWLGTSLASRYANYQLAISVSYDGSASGAASNGLVKRVTLNITAPDSTVLTFSALKGNW